MDDPEDQMQSIAQAIWEPVGLHEGFFVTGVLGISFSCYLNIFWPFHSLSEDTNIQIVPDKSEYVIELLQDG